MIDQAYDDDEGHADGDVAVADVDWGRVGQLEHRYDQAHGVEDGEDRKWAMLDLLSEMYGEDLEVW